MRLDRRGDEFSAAGSELLQTGLLIRVDGMLSTELITVKQIAAS